MTKGCSGGVMAALLLFAAAASGAAAIECYGSTLGFEPRDSAKKQCAGGLCAIIVGNEGAVTKRDCGGDTIDFDGVTLDEPCERAGLSAGGCLQALHENDALVGAARDAIPTFDLPRRALFELKLLLVWQSVLCCCNTTGCNWHLKSAGNPLGYY